MTAALHPVIAASMRPMTSMPAPRPASLNDDDIYVYDIKSLRIVASVGAKSIGYPVSTIGAKLAVPAGCAWAKGMALRGAGLWWGAAE